MPLAARCAIRVLQKAKRAPTVKLALFNTCNSFKCHFYFTCNIFLSSDSSCLTFKTKMTILAWKINALPSKFIRPALKMVFDTSAISYQTIVINKHTASFYRLLKKYIISMVYNWHHETYRQLLFCFLISINKKCSRVEFFLNSLLKKHYNKLCLPSL